MAVCLNWFEKKRAGGGDNVFPITGGDSETVRLGWEGDDTDFFFFF